ncbi:MAG TPA: YwqG family protein [Planctomycetota bacterium]|nr:YwqG family protein [Planctomycetota bacterium]
MRAKSVLAVVVMLSCSACEPAASDGAATAGRPARAPAPPPLSRPLDLEAVRRELQQRGLSRVLEPLAKLAQPCLLLQRRDGNAPAAPTSRLGGRPDLPSDARWPEWRGKPQSFLAQIRLEELPAEVVPELPRRGVLSFFYDSTQAMGGFGTDGLGCARVLFHEDAAACVPRDPPRSLPREARFCEVPMRAERSLSLPDISSAGDEAPELDDADDEAFRELAHEMHWIGAGHQIGGHPLPIQDSAMAASIAQVLDGDARRAADWLLLLQLESDDAAGWMWGDGGALYFWIRRADLAALRFDRVWMVFECH